MTIAHIMKYSITERTPFRWYPVHDVRPIIASIPPLMENKQQIVDMIYDFEEALSDVKTLIARSEAFRTSSEFTSGNDTYLVTFWASSEAYFDFTTSVGAGQEFQKFFDIRSKLLGELFIDFAYLPLVEIPKELDNQLGSLTLEYLLAPTVGK